MTGPRGSFLKSCTGYKKFSLLVFPLFIATLRVFFRHDHYPVSEFVDQWAFLAFSRDCINCAFIV